LLGGLVRWGTGGAVDGALVEGGRETDCSAVAHKCGDGSGDSRPGSDEVCVIGVSNGVHGRVRSSDGLECALKYLCEEERTERVPLTYPACGYNVDSVYRGCGEKADFGVSAVHKVHKWNEGGVPGCHSGEEISPVDGIESVRPVVREHHCVGWVGAEGGVDGVTDVFGPSWGPRLPRAAEGRVTALRRGAT
jgi:hypothetical protein